MPSPSSRLSDWSSSKLDLESLLKTPERLKEGQIVTTIRQYTPFHASEYICLVKYARLFLKSVLFCRCCYIHWNGNKDGIKLQEQVTETICSRKVRKLSIFIYLHMNMSMYSYMYKILCI